MKHIKLTYLLFGLMVVISSCVDDYEEANPPRALDGPFFTLEAGGDIIKTEDDGDFLAAGETAEFVINVVDAPGGIEAVETSIDEEELGAFEVDQASFNQVKGQTEGTFIVRFTPIVDLDEDVTVNLAIIVLDGQDSLKWFGRKLAYQKSHEETYTVTLASCTSTGLAGTYDAIASGNTIAAGSEVPYSDLESEIVITEIRPGLYRISDISFGAYDQIYNDDTPTGTVNLCGSDISDNVAIDQYDDPFTITGQINGDGTVSINWNNTWGDAGVVTLTKK
jgi:hypothetical protein